MFSPGFHPNMEESRANCNGRSMALYRYSSAFTVVSKSTRFSFWLRYT